MSGRAGIHGLHWFVTEYGSIYKAFVFRDYGCHEARGEYVTTSLADAKRVASERLRALTPASEGDPAVSQEGQA